MSSDTLITVIGNLTADPDLRFTPGGDAVANFTVATTPRTFDKATNDWVDGETLFLRCTAWREMAENIANSLAKGTRILVTGKLVSRSYVTKEGDNRTVMELTVEEVGPSLKWATTKVARTPQNGQGSGSAPRKTAGAGSDRGASRGAQRPPRPAPQADPWVVEDTAPPF